MPTCHARQAQVQALRAAHPGLCLFVECGYKYKLFGDDAHAAAGLLGIFASPHRSFLVPTVSASIPVHRLGVHVRRMVEHGWVACGAVGCWDPLCVMRLGSCEDVRGVGGMWCCWVQGSLMCYAFGKL